MKTVVAAFVVGLVGIMLWRLLSSSDGQSRGIDRLREAIDTSSLPDRARAEMHALIEQRRLRPSQYLEIPN